MSDSNVTKKMLADSMKKRMRRQPFDKISVSDLCGDCNINRKSFYYHFRDKYDLVNWIFFVDVVGEMDLDSYKSGWDWMVDISRFFYRDKEFYRCALEIEGQNSFKEYLIETMWPISQFFLKDLLPGMEHDEFFMSFICDTLITALVRWLSGGYGRDMTAEQFVEKIREVFRAMGKV